MNPLLILYISTFMVVMPVVILGLVILSDWKKIPDMEKDLDEYRSRLKSNEQHPPLVDYYSSLIEHQLRYLSNTRIRMAVYTLAAILSVHLVITFLHI